MPKAGFPGYAEADCDSLRVPEQNLPGARSAVAAPSACPRRQEFRHRSLIRDPGNGGIRFAGDLDSPKVVIDGGANIGLASAYFLNRYPSARTISVEPFEAPIALAGRTWTLMPQRSTILRGAIWPDEGSLCLDPHGQDWVNNRVRHSRPGQDGSVEAVTMKSLISLGGGSVDLLKLDVEGSEKEIFGSGAAEWLPKVRNILIELHGPSVRIASLEPWRPMNMKCRAATRSTP